MYYLRFRVRFISSWNIYVQKGQERERTVYRIIYLGIYFFYFTWCLMMRCGHFRRLFHGWRITAKMSWSSIPIWRKIYRKSSSRSRILKSFTSYQWWVDFYFTECSLHIALVFQSAWICSESRTSIHFSEY